MHGAWIPVVCLAAPVPHRAVLFMVRQSMPFTAPIRPEVSGRNEPSVTPLRITYCVIKGGRYHHAGGKFKGRKKNLKTPTCRWWFVMICAITQHYHEPAVRSKHGAAYSAANLGHAHHKRLISCLHPELLRKLHVVSIVPRGPRLAERRVIMA